MKKHPKITEIVKHQETPETVRTLYYRKIQAPGAPNYDKKTDTGQQLLIAPLQIQLPLL